MIHTLEGIASTREVYLDGQWLDPTLSQKYHNHSPDGFSWGYSGSGCAQLALAIMLIIMHSAEGYQDLKRTVIASLPFGEDFNIEFVIGGEDDIN